MSITITEKDVGRKVVRRNGEKVKISRWHNELSQQVEVNQLTLHSTDGFWLSSRKESEYDIIAFADEPAATALTEERIREIVREMMQPQPEKKELRRGECWINVYPKGVTAEGTGRNNDDGTSFAFGTAHFPSKEAADRFADPSRLDCVKVVWTEGEGLEGGAR